MYQLSNDEEIVLARWAKDVRWEYLRTHNYIFLEESLEETMEKNELHSEYNTELEAIESVDKDLNKNIKLKELFETDEKIAETFTCLSDEEEELIRMNIIHQIEDKVLAISKNTTAKAIKNKRNRGYEKARRKWRENKNVQ